MNIQIKTALIITLCVILLVLQCCLWNSKNGILKIFHLQRNIKTQQIKNDAILDSNTALRKEIKTLKQGREAIENRARSDLGMIKKGEVFYQIVK